MCIAILNQKGILSKKTLKTCWINNPDGAGFAWFNGSEVIIKKELKDFNSFYKEYVKERQKTSADFLIHFRIATHGKVNETNCHPFRINKKSAFIHNGIISATSLKGDYSDTYNFNELIVKKLPGTWYNNKAIINLISDYIGYSKLVFLLGSHSLIINENLGKWDGYNWFSNDSYKPYEKLKPAASYSLFPKNDKWEKWDEKELKEDSYYNSISEDYYNSCGNCDYCLQYRHLKYSRQYNCDLCEDCLRSFDSTEKIV